MIEGFWILRISASGYTSGGVCIFTGGKVFGGDNGFTWVGSYSVNGKIMKGRVLVHNFDPAVPSIMSAPGDYEMFFSGNIESDLINGTALVAGQPQHSLAVQLTKQASL